MKKKNIILIIAAVLLIILLIFVVFMGEKRLKTDSKIVIDLHNSLGEVDIDKCGGLITYSDKTITETDLEIDNRLCKAYYSLEDNEIVSEIAKTNNTTPNKAKICQVGKNTTLTTTDEKETECQYEIVEIQDLKDNYLKIYGKDITIPDSFYISSEKACFKEGERYYCGNAENYKISIVPEATIYRVINKAIEKSDGEIIIYDYFLKVNKKACYSKNNNEENKTCSEELREIDLANDKEVISFVKKYGSIYKHTFKEDKNQNHYWFKTELK